MIAMTTTSRAALAAVLSLSLHAAHADGLFDSLPPNSMEQSCADPAQLSLARAGAAVHAAYFPLQPMVTESVLGVLLHDDPRAIAVVRRSLGERPPPGWSNASHCSNTVCALKAALGGDDQAWEGALWALEIGAHGIVASLDQAPWPSGKLSLWTASELHTVAAALHDLPSETLARASNLRVIRRAPNGDSLQGNSNALSERSEHRLDGGGSINLSDKVWKMNPQQKREIIVHEIGHHFDYAEEKRTHLKYALSHGDEWLSIGGWSTSGDLGSPSGFHRTPSGEEAWTAGSWPSEEFANAIAEYRYQGRLLRDYSPRAYAYAGRYFDRNYLLAASDPDLDHWVDTAGGGLALFQGCAEMVQGATERPDGGPAMLLLTGSQSFDRWSFISHSACVANAIRTLSQKPGFSVFACNRDPEELFVRVSSRLQEVEDSVFEALKAAPNGIDSEIAHKQAIRVAAEFAPILRDQHVIEVLAQQILKQAKAAVSADASLPLANDGKEMFAACLATVSSVTYKGDGEWRFWVKVPPNEETRGFPEPIRTAACTRDFGADLLAHGMQLDAASLEQIAKSTKSLAYPLAQQFIQKSLMDWETVRSVCRLPQNAKIPPPQQACAVRWFADRLVGLVPEKKRVHLAQQLVEEIKGP
jgi:hypothetical protein